MPITDINPMMTFQAARYLALGVYFPITTPEIKIPKAENISPRTPVIKLDAAADCLYWVSIYLGMKIQ